MSSDNKKIGDLELNNIVKRLNDHLGHFEPFVVTKGEATEGSSRFGWRVERMLECGQLPEYMFGKGFVSRPKVYDRIYYFLKGREFNHGRK